MREQEREARGVGPSEAQEPRGGHGHAGPARAGDQRQRLGHADDQRARQGHIGNGPLLRPDHVGDHHQDAVDDGIPGDDGHVSLEIGIAQLLENDAEGDGRDGGEHDIDGEPPVVGDLAFEQEERALDQPPHVAPEIDEDGKQRAEMRHDIDDDALILPMHQLGNENQMPGGGNRQELGDALHHREHDDLLYRHIPLSPRLFRARAGSIPRL